MSGEFKVCLFAMALTIGFCVAALAIGVWSFQFGSVGTNLTVFFAGWMIAASIQSLITLARARPEKPIGYLKASVFGPTFRKRVRESWPIFLGSVIFFPGFSIMKSAIPLFNDYGWDGTFINWDIALHGRDAWRVLQPFIGFPLITSLLSMAYHLWILLIYGGTIFLTLYCSDRTLRVRYFSAYFAAWTINGVVLAIVFSSVGPCFVEPLLGNKHFAEQMRYLNHANENFPVMVLRVQQWLLEGQLHGSNTLGRGITAMPSMHVSLAFLFFLAIRQVSRRAGHFFFAFLIVIMVGSVHLGYHYAVDGYVSIITTAIIWWVCGRLVRAKSNERIMQPAELSPA